MIKATTPKSVEVPKETLKSFKKLVSKERYLVSFLRKHNIPGKRKLVERILEGKTVAPETLELIESIVSNPEPSKTAA